MIKPLIINRDFLFAHSPNGECLRSFIGGMTEDEWKPIVYGSDKRPIVKKEANEEIILTHEYNSPKYIAAVIRRFLLPDLTWLPGYEWWSWGIGCKRKILKDIYNKEFDYIHSISFPCASHTVALKVKQKTGLPWVAQFYDPWADNPYRPFKTNYFKKKDWTQESECARNADLIIHNNESIADLWRQRYGDDLGKKIVVLPLTVPIPPLEVSANSHRTEEILTISHIGNFVLNRTSHSFIKAVKILLKRHPEYYGRLRINYIGRVTDDEKSLICENGLKDIFNLVGTISSDSCIDYYIKSDIFLVIDGVNKDNIFFPSKILKYFFFRRPILGITPRGSVLDKELHRAGHISISNDDLESIALYLEKALTDYSSLLSFDQDYWHNFDPQNVVEQYRKVIERMLSTR